jgi:hypothetical protein
LLAGCTAALLLPARAQEAVVIGGVTPSVRPANSPSVNNVLHGPAWYQQALRGVTEPYPRSLFFLEHQGQWYTPFTRPGMPGSYDIRGLHRASH